jgi:hypothetical protein
MQSTTLSAASSQRLPQQLDMYNILGSYNCPGRVA